MKRLGPKPATSRLAASPANRRFSQNGWCEAKVFEKAKWRTARGPRTQGSTVALNSVTESSLEIIVLDPVWRVVAFPLALAHTKVTLTQVIPSSLPLRAEDTVHTASRLVYPSMIKRKVPPTGWAWHEVNRPSDHPL